MRQSDLPNFYMIGAPKCGTTSMFHWLSEHPEVCTSHPKETYFFADPEIDILNVKPNHRDDDMVDYLKCFGPVDRSTRVKSFARPPARSSRWQSC